MADQDPRRTGEHRFDRMADRDTDRQTDRQTDRYVDRKVERFFGGSPVSVVAQLIVVSTLVGVILAAVGFDPWNIIDSVRRLVAALWSIGFDGVHWLWRYFLLGAVVVVPVWLLTRLLGAPRRR